MWDSVLHAITEYTDLGYDTLPLAPGTKMPIERDWQKRTSADMWRNVPNDVNIGIRCGGELSFAAIDADDKNDPRTSQNVMRYLASLGVDAGDYPLIETPTGGRHFWLTLSGDLNGNARELSSGIGAGEFRYGMGAQIAAPPSIVNSNIYRLIKGDFRSLPRIELRDVLPILANQTIALTPLRPTISRNAWHLLNGKGVDRYISRSEAEQALLASLANTQHDFSSVFALCLQYPCAGKFHELYNKNPQRATKWLQHSYDQARQFVATHQTKGRQRANTLLEWAVARAWSGRTGSVDQSVLVAHCQIAKRAGRIEYQASCRDLAELAQVSAITATHATHRLINAGLMLLVKASTASFANIYRLGQPSTLPHIEGLGECTTLSLTHHDAFRPRGFARTFKAVGLGKSGRQVFDALQNNALTIAELSERTGRHPKTIRRVLNRMREIVDKETGEVIDIVEKAGERWRVRDGVDLDRVAHAMGTFGGDRWQRKRHERKREHHHLQLAQLMDSE